MGMRFGGNNRQSTNEESMSAPQAVMLSNRSAPEDAVKPDGPVRARTWQGEGGVAFKKWWLLFRFPASPGPRRVKLTAADDYPHARTCHCHPDPRGREEDDYPCTTVRALFGSS